MASNVVLIHCGDHRENQRRLLALACDLRDRGWVPVMICYRSAGAFFLAKGIDVFTLDLADEGRRDLSRAFESHFGVLASLALGTSFAGLDTKSLLPAPEVRTKDQAKALYRVLRRVRRLRAMLLDIEPAHVFIWNGYTGVVANCLRQLCAHLGIEHSFLERGLLPDSVFVDAMGVNGYSQLHHQSLKQLRQRLIDTHGDAPPPRTRKTPSDLRKRHGLNAERLLFVPLQVQRDTNILLHSDHFNTMSGFVTAISDAVIDQDVVVVVRAHPEEVDSDLGLPNRENLRYIAEGNVDEWCACADLTITINSTVGLTAILEGRPVVALGRAIYTGKGLCGEADESSLQTILSDSKTYEAPDEDDLSVFRRALLGLYTAGPNHCPDFLGPPPDSSRSVRPHNMYATEAARIASRWQNLLLRTRGEMGGEDEIDVSNQLSPKDAADRTYRETKSHVSEEELQHGLAKLLETSASRIRVSPYSARSSSCAIVVAPQSARPPIGRGMVLVVDQYLDPHVQWLLRS